MVSLRRTPQWPSPKDALRAACLAPRPECAPRCPPAPEDLPVLFISSYFLLLSIAVDSPYCCVLVSGAQHSGQTIMPFTQCLPMSCTHPARALGQARKERRDENALRAVSRTRSHFLALACLENPCQSHLGDHGKGQVKPPIHLPIKIQGPLMGLESLF